MEQDFEKVRYYLDLAASHYGYGTFDIFANSDLYEKEEKAEKIMRLAELIQKEVHKSQKELYDEGNFSGHRRGAELRNILQKAYDSLCSCGL